MWVESRVEDLHTAFRDKSVKAIFCAKGGYNSNQLLKHIDWELIKNNPKPIMGYSDIDVLTNAIRSKTGMITYLAPTFSFFGKDKAGMDYSIEMMKKCLFSDEPFELYPSKEYTYEVYEEDKPKAEVTPNEGWKVLSGGSNCWWKPLHL